MDFKISDTNKRKKSLIYGGFIYRIDGVLKCEGISWRCTNKKCKKCKGHLRTDSAMSTMNAINLSPNPCTARDGKSTQFYLNPEKMCTLP